ncbi:energy transducer TonB [Phenylobacterium hankyongense]|nr:energy transducer TonB [Phenylobacterium hankyongense]
MTRRELSPAMLGSVLLHASVAAALLISWRFNRDLKVGTVVPVTIVANAPSTDIRPAIEAPETQTAQAEQSIPDAPPQAAPPAPQPQPLPPAPAPAPAKAAPPTPAPKAIKPAEATPAAKPQPPTKADKGLDLDALAATVSKMSKPAGARPSSAAKGLPRPETAPQARPAIGAGVSAAALSGLTDELQRRWNPNCDVEAGRDIQVRVAFTLGAGGQVVGNVTSQIRGAQNALSQAAADRAVRAVYAASPFRNLPREFYGDKIAVNFNAREACSS